MKKLVLVKYLGFNPDKELCTIGQFYPYLIDTRKQIKPKDFIVLADKALNDDRNTVSTVRVLKIADDYTDEEKVDKLLAECNGREVRTKLFIGKAELGDYFAELDKKRKREELQQKIEKRFKEAEKEALYRKLAETDPQMKELLAQLDELK